VGVWTRNWEWRGRVMSSNWNTVAESKYPWERDALDFVRQNFPAHEPYRAWANFEFIADDGSINEVDLLVLTPMGFFLVEIKSRPGTLRGDAGTWTWEHEGKQFTDDNPVFAANRKAKKLKSLLEKQKAIRNFKGRMPFLETLVFCSAPGLDLKLEGTARYRVCPRDQDAAEGQPARPGIIAALERRDCPGLDAHPKGQGDRAVAKAISQAMHQIGVRPSNKARKVLDFVLGNLLMEGSGFQDWQAMHVKLEEVKRRVRLYLVQTGATPDDRKTIERAALREFQLLESLQHPGILRTHGFTEHELGPALIFEHHPKSIRLDHYLSQCGQRLQPEVRLDLLRQIAEVVRFAHDKKVIHRALSPQSILITDPDTSRPHIKVFNWQVGHREAGSSAGATRGRVTGTIHPEQLVENASTAYMAPEALLDSESIGEHLDVFSLGAIAYHLFSGQAPAANALELGEKLRQSPGLQISSVVNGASENLQSLIQCSTNPEVSSRTDSARDFLDGLDRVQQDLLNPDTDVVEDPTQAQIGDKLPGGLVVKKRLGSGACSVALLVERDSQELVLKVASAAEHNDRLRNEGEVLQKLHPHQHIVQHLETLEMGGHVCLLMRRAGTETLSDRLSKEGRLLVDLLQRFGEDLLDVVRFLEEQGIPHRDIKPGNIAVGKVGRGDKLHLVLFDFSLSRTPLENIRAGTKGYLEPFLAERKPARWDLHAERFAAAVTLYELATGSLPTWGDGKSDPALVPCEAQIDPEVFDASLRDQLAAFFRKALRRNPADRFDNAEEMLRAWRHAFEGIKPSVSTGHEDWVEVEKRLQQATLDTPIAELGLGIRACNALDRVNVLTVRDLLAFKPRRLSRLRGVGNKTRREIIDALKILRPRLGGQAEPVPPTTLAGPETLHGGPEPTVLSVDLLVGHVARSDPRARSDTERRFLAAFLGLDPGLSDPWPSQTDVAIHLGVSRGRVGQLAGAAQERWKRDPSVTRLRADVLDILTTAQGVMAIDELAGAVLLARGSVEDEPRRSRLALAVTRAAVEVERVMTEPRLVVRRDRDRVLVAVSQPLADYALRLGHEADSLAAEDPLVPPARVLERLRAVRAPAGVEPLADARLVRLAATSSQTGAVSSIQEVYPRGMDGSRALRLSRGALLGMALVTVEEVRQRVSGRYPEAAPLPDRPELDALLKAELGLDWDATAVAGGAYRNPERELLVSSSPSVPITRRATQPGPPVGEITPEEAQARLFEERLQRALADGGFVAMTVEPRGYFLARDELCRRFPVQQIDLEALFLRLLRDVAEKAKVKWDRVLSADTAPGSDDWGKLMVLVRRAVPQVESSILAAQKTVLLVYPGLLARYEQMDVLQRLRNKVGRPDGIPGLWMLIAADESAELPVLDGHAVPVIGRAEWARVPESWLRNDHRSNGKRGATR